mmetsp:Transcript_1316/g.1391  ORF Transcript_1316/g.1391 Transcript_1316/m.1391 type:complete len:104 (-) Transcript_1316:148-459(-)|eukprot:CAMPEP_0115007892 /NCGR_PEP_ID=MMETSP0216-20121206/21529_1 /TAXON_ID=223996 /ORGANISM="Protocruzia adherens, Strain Boccale" /LENGTH=103 /DNA_ID=CAMNT_0002375079 /DNA_START=16 /DNA_END=327 /DNA_ORIENTATION=-
MSENKDTKEEQVPEETRSGVKALKAQLNKVFRVTLSDDRRVIGRFSCVDKQSNLVFSDAAEVRYLVNDDHQRRRVKRFIGNVVIPGNHIKKFELDKTLSSKFA